MQCCLTPISACYGDNAKVRFQRPVVIIVNDRIDNSMQTDSPEEAAVDNDDVHEEQQNAQQVMNLLQMLSGEWTTLTTLDSPGVEIQDGVVIWNEICEYNPTRLWVWQDQVVMELEGIQFKALLSEDDGDFQGRLVLQWSDGDAWLQRT